MQLVCAEAVKIILSTLLLLSCCFIPVQGLYDDRIAPKCYMAAVVAAVIAATCAICMIRRQTAVTASRHALAVAAAIVMAYNIACVVVYDFILAPSSQMHLPIRGTFDNPAGYALSICILMSTSMWQATELGRRARTAVLALCITASITVVMSLNRCGMLFLAVYWTVFVIRQLRCATWIKYTTAVSIVIAGSCIALSTKQGSTSGRHFILERTWELIQQRPLTGYGHHGFEREYMPQQARYFMAYSDSAVSWLADDILHPFNEWLYVWVNYGIVATVALLLLFIIPIILYLKSRDRSLGQLIPPLIAVMMFATTSYPHQYPMAWIIVLMPYIYLFRQHLRSMSIAIVSLLSAILLLAVTIREGIYEHRWHHANEGVSMGYARQALPIYESLREHYSGNPRFLYSMMFCQYQARRFDKAADTYETLSHMVATYDMELLMGDICLHDGKPGRSLSHYTRAMYMVPVRFAPLDGQLRAYAMMGDTLRADSVARVIMGKRVKVPSAAVEQIRHEAEKALLKEF